MVTVLAMGVLPAMPVVQSDYIEDQLIFISQISILVDQLSSPILAIIKPTHTPEANLDLNTRNEGSGLLLHKACISPIICHPSSINAQLHAEAKPLRAELAERLQLLTQAAYVGQARRRLERVRRRRLRLRERAREREAELEAEATRAAEREQEIDRWRVKCVQEVEEKKREQELKAAADGVLSEVRKKQADTKRMVDILRALEKLRKLRKEAAARKGVCPPASADETFEHHLQRLRKLNKKRSELYEAEERVLRVMLEGEQEEERKRELEKKQRKEKEKFLLQKREIESKLFGDPDEFPLAHLLQQPFRQYYLQAEHSLPALIQIRHDWDQYLVPSDHPKGNSVLQGWVLPPLPSNDIWATAIKLH
ncbi:hypothetical protein EI555_005022 [Monodon monoceros]|uniref:Programmed cell death protein 7 n=1 Tax=Monodon monoceros TaxID=40151 RepID=A0A4U1F4V6_MONMO|nr:hypothetical protein EI555_005022 [Monodon monoceros]